MRGKIRTFTYTFDKQFHLGTKDQFILEFFQDDKIISTLQISQIVSATNPL